MSAPFRLSVITPEKVFFDGETTQIIVRTTEGDIGILANHTILVANLPSGPLRIMQEDGKYRAAAVSSGVLKVGNNKATILATAVEWADEIDIQRAKHAEEEARLRLKSELSAVQFEHTQLKLQRALNRINVSEKM